jgi:integrase
MWAIWKGFEMYADDRFVASVDSHERQKDFLDAEEMARLLDAAKSGRHATRNYLLILMMYRHGLRVSEATSLRIDAINLQRARLWVRRSKGSLSTEQPIEGDELRALRRYLAQRNSPLPWLFLSERKGPLDRTAVFRIVAAAGKRAGLGHVWPHMLRHSCGFHLANRGVDFRVAQDYLGHRCPRHTMRYTRVASRRFEGLWS